MSLGCLLIVDSHALPLLSGNRSESWPLHTNEPWQAGAVMCIHNAGRTGACTASLTPAVRQAAIVKSNAKHLACVWPGRPQLWEADKWVSCEAMAAEGGVDSARHGQLKHS